MDLICCSGNCLCILFKNSFASCMEISPKIFSRIGYIFLSISSVIISLIILFYGSIILKPFNSWIKCPEINNEDELFCLGISSVYRMSMALVILHLIIIISYSCSKKISLAINNGCWSLKLLIILGLYFSFLFINNSVFIVYATIANYLSLLFILYQVMVTISFAHIINLTLVNKLDQAIEKGESEFMYQFLLLGLSTLFSGLSLFWTLWSLIQFSYSWLNVIIICLTIIMGIAFTVLSISEIVTSKRLLTSINKSNCYI